jgi:hypothetical protein
MRRLPLALCLLCAAGWAEEPADLSGLWVGTYEYGAPGEHQTVEFSVVFEQQHKVLLGRMLERQTFGAEPAVGLSANLAGVVSGQQATLVKTYDGTGGQTHSIAYELVFDPAKQTLSGTWSVAAGWDGKTLLRRMTPQEIERLAKLPPVANAPAP